MFLSKNRKHLSTTLAIPRSACTIIRFAVSSRSMFTHNTLVHILGNAPHRTVAQSQNPTPACTTNTIIATAIVTIH